MRDKAVAIAEIAEGLPQIMRHLAESRPLTGRESELTLGQVRALGVLAHRDHCTMGELARRLGIGLSAATGLVDRLVQHGAVERDNDPHDRRVVCVRLSRAGRRAGEAFHKERRRHMEAALGGLSAAELNQIADGIALLRKAVGVPES